MFLLSTAYSQYFVGLGIEEIKTEMKQKKEDFSFSKEVNAEEHHFLKFENANETQTILFILDDNEKCKFTKLICDYSLLRTMEDSLNNTYEYRKDMSWVDTESDENYNYLMELEKEDWFFTIKTTRKKK